MLESPPWRSMTQNAPPPGPAEDLSLAANATPDPLFGNGGEMGVLMSSVDWPSTSFGPVAQWSQGLRTAVRIMLQSSFGMVIAWGPDFRFLYNDRYRPVLGSTKHPNALGESARVTFPEAWSFIGPLFEQTRRGESVALDDVLIPLDRNGYLENCYFTLSYSPILDGDEVGGMLAVVYETTQRVEAERRLTTLRDLANQATQAQTVADALRGAASVLGSNPIDVPFSALYQVDTSGTRAQLVCTSGSAPEHVFAPAVELGSSAVADSPWPLARAMAERRIQVVDGLDAFLEDLPGGPYPERAHTVVVVPLARPGALHPYAVLVAGVSPRRAFDDLYRGFYELAAEHIVSGISNARSYQEERDRAKQQERQQAAAALAASEERFRAIVSQATTAVIQANLDCTYTLANDRYCQMVGYTQEELLQMNIQQLTHPDDRARHRQQIDALLAGGPSFSIEKRCLRRDGQAVWVSSNMTALRGLDGGVESLVAVMLDIDDKKQAESALQQSEAQLREADRRKDEFLAMLAHELRNPLAPISNAVQLLKRAQITDPMQHRAHTIIERQTGRLTQLVDDLLEVSRITSGRIQLHPSRVDLAVIVARAAESVAPLVARHSHSLRLPTGHEPIWVHADAARLEQVLINLLTNAAKYTKDGGDIAVEMHGDQNHAVLSVSDTGIGIDAGVLPRIFDIFFQADNSLDRSSGGLGVGLALVQQLVRMHGGSVEVASVVGQGSRFTVRLPKVAAPEQEEAESTSPSPMARAQLRVLVVDDNVDAADTLALLIESGGHQVRVVSNGEAALSAADEHVPDIAFLDIGLPKLDGYQVATLLRQRRHLAHLELVAMTGYGQQEDRERSFRAGFNNHLVKPVAFEMVEKVLEEVGARKARHVNAVS